MNTSSFVVATVLTVYGIETNTYRKSICQEFIEMLQQYLPFTVLKLKRFKKRFVTIDAVATVLTVYGIETR